MKKLPSILFFCINGSGMGHLTRCLAYARRLQGRADCLFFSLASAMEFVEAFGFSGDYFVSPFWSVNASHHWNAELCVRFGMMLERVRPDVVVFDGTWPFHGFLAACQAYGRPLAMVWSRRGLLRRDVRPAPVDERLFDLVIVPGELGDVYIEEDSAGVHRVHVPPVLLLEEAELLPRTVARVELGLCPDGHHALMSLGSGNLKDVQGPGLLLTRSLQDAGFAVVWARPPISVHDVLLPDDVRALSVYPLARYLRAFDVLVGAAGYNTCHEVAQTRIPSLMVPNTLLADDQSARARMLAKYAPVVVGRCGTEAEVREAVRLLSSLAGQGRQETCAACALDGAGRAAEAILRLTEK